ncbi:MAG: biotin/lipoyl-containing protein [Candidatus Aadella gelida]|nr:biotin/lipoyl-containing protein [Candidatus Aadella gelida]
MELKLPEITEKNDTTIVTCWHIKENECVVKDQDIVEVSSDKATFDVSAPWGGTLKKIIKNEGEEVLAGETLAEIEEQEK